MSLPALHSSADIRSITERVNAIIKQIYNLVIPVGAANTVLTSDGTTLAWAALPTYPITNTGATTFLGADVALNNAANFFDGPNTGSIGANGQTWLILAGGVIASPSAATTGEFAIYNGSAYIADTTSVGTTANFPSAVSLAVVVALSGATTFTLRAKGNDTTAVLLTTGLSSGVTNKATYITAVRLA
jgi:hypothetical protein